MNVLDRAISVFSPSWAAERVRSRGVLAAYEAALPSRTHKAKKSHGNADRNVRSAKRSLTAQARHLEENSDFVDGLFNTLVNNVVGQHGISVEPMPLRYDGTVHQEFAEKLRKAHSEWSLKCDSTGTMSRPELSRLVCRTWLRDGECFGEHILGDVPNFKHPSGQKYSIQALEPDFIPFDMDLVSLAVSQGIERNLWGQPIKYHAYLYHPGDSGVFGTQTRAIPADKMMHIKLVKRLHQGRGITILASSLQRIAGLQNYEESELIAARIAASLAFYIKRGDPEMFDKEGYEDGDDDDDDRQSMSIAPGTIFNDLKPGEDVGMIESKRPSALLAPFRSAMLKMVCSATGANASTVNKEYNGTYSSQRQELVESYVSYGVLSNAFVAQWERPSYRMWNKMAILTGVVDVPPDVDPRTVNLAYYQCPMMPWIDPAKEAKGFNDIVAGGFGTESEVIRSRGKNPQEVKSQRKAEIEENRKYGLVYKSDAYHEFYGAKDAKADKEAAADGGDGDGGDDD